MYNVSMIEHFFFDITSIRNRIGSEAPFLNHMVSKQKLRLWGFASFSNLVYLYIIY